jgi:hypothetical protein
MVVMVETEGRREKRDVMVVMVETEGRCGSDTWDMIERHRHLYLRALLQLEQLWCSAVLQFLPRRMRPFVLRVILDNLALEPLKHLSVLQQPDSR